MNRESDDGTSASLKRRDFIGVLAGAAASLVLTPTLNLSAVRSVPSPVVSIHMDQPYLDWSGTATPYYPPPGARAGQTVAPLDEESLRFHYCYL
jgi:hypothetical protein